MIFLNVFRQLNMCHTDPDTVKLCRYFLLVIAVMVQLCFLLISILAAVGKSGSETGDFISVSG